MRVREPRVERAKKKDRRLGRAGSIPPPGGLIEWVTGVTGRFGESSPSKPTLTVTPGETGETIEMAVQPRAFNTMQSPAVNALSRAQQRTLSVLPGVP